MDRLTILITGASGMLGKAIIFENNKFNHVLYGTYLSSKINLDGVTFLKTDISNRDEFLQTVKDIYPDVVIHTASLTNVDLCEKDKELAYKVNVAGTKNVVEFARKKSAKLIYISTDFVFDGNTGNYSESDMPNPVNYYGFTKLKGEEIALDYWNSLVIRTSIFGLNPSGSKPGIEMVIENMRNGNKVFAPIDSFYTPVSVNSLARAIYYLVGLSAVGLYHFGSTRKISRFEFLQILCAKFKIPINVIIPISFKEYMEGKFAKRPRDVSLKSLKVVKDHQIDLPDIEEDIEEIFSIKELYLAYFGGRH